MRVVGTFHPHILRDRPETVQKNTGFAAMLAFNLDRKPGEDDVTALFATNSSELHRLYEQTTGKTLGEASDSNTVVVTFQNRILPRSYWAGEFLDESNADSYAIPFRHIPSNQNMRYAVR